MMKTLFILIFTGLVMTCSAQEYLKLGDECYNKKDYACAYDNYMRGHEAGLNSVKDVLYYRLGYCLMSLKRNEESIRWFWRSITEKNALSPNWDLASVYLNLKKYDSSAFYYQKAFNLATTTEQKRNISYWAGASYFNLKDYTKAKNQLIECVKLDTSYVSSLTLLGRTYHQLKEYKNAEGAFEKAIKYSKDSLDISDLYLKIGEVYYTQREYSKSIPHYLTSYRFDPTFIKPLIYIGDAHSNVSRLDSATAYYQKAIDIELPYEEDMDSAQVASLYAAMGAVQLRKTDTAKAISYIPLSLKYSTRINSNLSLLFDAALIKKDLKILESTFSVYVNGLKANNNSLTAARHAIKLAELLGSLKQPQKAYSYYRNAVVTAPSYSDAVVPFIEYLIGEKKYKEAMDSLNRLMPVATNASVYTAQDVKALKGELLFLQKDTANAGVLLREVVRASYANHNANYLLGLMALQRKDTISCRIYWERMRSNSFKKEKYKDKNFPMHRFMAMDYLNKGNANGPYASSSYSAAASHFDYILSVDSSLPVDRIYSGVANLKAGKTYTGKSVLLGAVNFYQKKKDSLALIYRWLALAEMRGETVPNFAKAIEYYNKALQGSPQDSVTVNDLGNAYYEQKDYTKASETFTKSIAITKGSANKALAYYNRALCYYMGKKKAEGLADVNKSLELNGNYANAKQLKTELEKLTQ